MSYIKITNNGEIDINALTLLGASSKAGDAAKIGFFGSGNKYALATFLRNGIGVRIFSGAQEFAIELEAVEFRGQDFQRIVINGIQTSLTTRTGPEWELWMAVREFICNAIDEGGFAYDNRHSPEPAAPGTTTIYLEETEELARIFDNIEEIVIAGIEPLASVATSYGEVELHNAIGGRVYRKGICCSTQYQHALFSYSFADIAINESRLVSSEYLIHERIASALAACTDRAIVARVFDKIADERLEDDWLESAICSGSYWQSCYCTSAFSSTWRDVVLARGKVVCPVAYAAFMPAEDAASYLLLPTGFYSKLIADWPDIPHVGDGSTEWCDADPAEPLSEKVNAALMDVKALGIAGSDRDFNIRWVNFVNDATVMQSGARDSAEILVSVKERDDVDYAAGLLEEIIHKTTGFGDGSRALQTLLFTRWLAAERRAARNEAFVTLVESAVTMRRN